MTEYNIDMFFKSYNEEDETLEEPSEEISTEYNIDQFFNL